MPHSAPNRTPDAATFEARVDQDVGRAIRSVRKLKGLTQGELASSVGVVMQQVQKYETGANRIGASRLASLAKALGVSVCDLYPRELQP